MSRAEHAGLRREVICELIEICLTDENASSGVQPLDDGRIRHGDAVTPVLRCCCRAHARGVKQVLVGDWDSVQRSAIMAASEFRI